MPIQIVPGKGSESPLQLTPSALPPKLEAKTGVNVSKLPSGLSSTLLNWLKLVPASRSPCMAPPKLVAVYSSIPLVLVPQIVTISSTGPSGLAIPGPLQSPSTGLAEGTGGQLAGSPILASVVDPGVDPSGSYISVLKTAPALLVAFGVVYNPAPLGLALTGLGCPP